MCVFFDFFSAGNVDLHFEAYNCTFEIQYKLGVPGAQRVAIAKRLLIERGNYSLCQYFT